MAVAIGGFSLLWDSQFASLPFEHGDRFVAIRDLELEGSDDAPPTLAVYREWEQRQTSLDRLAATFSRLRDVSDGAGGSARYPVASITPAGLEMTGVRPLLGRALLAADQEPGAEPVVVVGHRVWRLLLGSDPGVLGRTMVVGGERRTVIGVMPEGFRFPVSDDLWLPLDTDPARTGGVEPRWLRVFGRLADGTSIERAEAELDAIRAGYAAEHPESPGLAERRTSVAPYVKTESEPGAEVMFQVMFLFMLLVLAIACASVANLLLSRTSSRAGEIAVRAAMGASRGRLVRQLLIEALLLTAGGAAVGVLVAQAGLTWFGSNVPLENTPFWLEFGMNPATVVFAVVAAFVAALLAGVAPALKATSAGMQHVLKDEQRSASGVRFGRWSGALTVIEVALSVAFLAASALAAQSLLDATASTQALPGRQILVAEVSLVDESTEDASGGIVVPAGAILPDRWPLVREDIRAAASALPGVRAVVVTAPFALPGQQHSGTFIEVEGETGGEPAAGVRTLMASVSPELFDAFDVALLAGRHFDGRDDLASEPVAIVNAPMARRFFGNESPVGRRFREASTGEAGSWIRIVGVAAALQMNPSGGDQPGFYRTFTQSRAIRFMLALRVGDDTMALASALQVAVKGVDARIDIANIETHEELAKSFLASYRLMSLMFAALGGTALFLSVASLYAVMSFSVTRRTREIGLRVALGGSRQRVVGSVLRRGLRQIGLGVVIGGIAGFGLLRLLSFIPIGVAPGGPLLLAVAASAMLTAGLMACVPPAVRALRIQPVEALRHD
jgi:predicted permease